MATVTTEDLERIVEKAVRACSLPLPELAPAAADTRSLLMSLTFEEIGFDSLNFMEFCIAIAVEVGVELSAEEVAELKTPDAVVRHLSQRR